MNLFLLSRKSISKNARAYHDKHLIKLILEATQIASGALTLLHRPAPYRLGETYKSHPMIRWAASSSDSFLFVINTGLGLAREYYYRFGKERKERKGHPDGHHACRAILLEMRSQIPTLSGWIPYQAPIAASPTSCFPGFPLCLDKLPVALQNVDKPVWTHRVYMIWKTLTAKMANVTNVMTNVTKNGGNASPQWKNRSRPSWWSKLEPRVSSVIYATSSLK